MANDALNNVPGAESQINNEFLRNNEFQNFDSLMPDGHDGRYNEQWNFTTDINLAPETSLPQTWQDEVKLSPSTTPYGNQADAYTRRFPENDTNQFVSSGYHAPSNFSTFSQSQYDATNSTGQGHSYGFEQSSMPLAAPGLGTIAPQALQSRPAVASESAAIKSPYTSQQGNVIVHDAASTATTRQATIMPKGKPFGMFLQTTVETLDKAVSSRRLHNFTNVSDDPIEVAISKFTIPTYIPRKSRNDIKRLLASDPKLSAKITQRRSKKLGLAPRRVVSSHLDDSGKLSSERTRRASQVSSSEEESSESEYESSSEDEEEKPPLPTSRPSLPLEAVRYDTIKALWRPSNRPLSRESIKHGLETFWEIVSTIRDRWKSDTGAVKQAEEAKKVNEIPLLQERVSKQRDMLEAAMKAASEFGHEGVIEKYVTIKIPSLNLTLYCATNRKGMVVHMVSVFRLARCISTYSYIGDLSKPTLYLRHKAAMIHTRIRHAHKHIIFQVRGEAKS